MDKGSLMERNLACDSEAVEDHGHGKLRIIHSLIIKQATLEHKAEMLALCIAGKRAIPLDPPGSPSGSFFWFQSSQGPSFKRKNVALVSES